MKTLWDLSEEYLEQERLIKARVLELKQRIKHLRGEESRLMAARIEELTRMYYDCRRIGRYLRNYYTR